MEYQITLFGVNTGDPYAFDEGTVEAENILEAVEKACNELESGYSKEEFTIKNNGMASLELDEHYEFIYVYPKGKEEEAEASWESASGWKVEEDEEDESKEEVQEVKNKKTIMEDKLAQTIALLEKASGRKVTLVEAKEESSKEKKVIKAVAKAAEVAPANIEKTAAGIIPPSAIQTIQAFMDETLASITEGVEELQEMKIDANTIASGEDFYDKAQDLQDSIKQVARMCTFVKNTIIAKKFDANLLDKIVSYKNAQATVVAPIVTPAPAPVTPIV